MFKILYFFVLGLNAHIYESNAFVLHPIRIMSEQDQPAMRPVHTCPGGRGPFLNRVLHNFRSGSGPNSIKNSYLNPSD